MSTRPAYYVQRNVLDSGPWYLRRGNVVPADVPEELVAAWLKAKHIGETKPTAEKKG